MGLVIKWLVRIVMAVVVLAALSGAGLYYYVHGSLPGTNGSMRIAGLGGEVRITRDKEGVPHIFGRGDDVFAGIGFAHAQDRIWQMEMLRRAGQGRLSEMFGKTTVKTDEFLKTIDLYAHAKASYAKLRDETKASLESYARGVNAWLARSGGFLRAKLPPEFIILGHKPEPWKPEDSLVVVKMMAFDLGGNLSAEVRRLALAADGRTPAEIEELMPSHRDDSPPPLPDLGKLLGLGKAQAVLGPRDFAMIGRRMGEGASNNWVIDGSRTKSGKPLLANDPHLRLGAPSIWYLAHLAFEKRGGGVTNLVGASLPGTPLVVLGRNDRIAWGFTNTGPDVQDLFIEKTNPDNPNEYKTPDGWQPFRSEKVTIKVKGSDDVVFTRRTSRHGPVLPGFYKQLDKLLPSGHVAALKWTALRSDDTTIQAGMQNASAATVADYVAAMQDFQAPMQSMVIGSVDGEIGFIAPGRVPVRSSDNNVAGRAPVPGWEARYDWQGYLAFSDLPRKGPTAPGAILTANSKIVGPEYDHHLTFDWRVPYRQDRVAEMLNARQKHDVESFAAMQADVYSPAIAELKPLLIAAARKADNSNSDVLDALAKWNAYMVMDSPEPLIMAAWMRHVLERTFKDDLPNAFGFYEGRIKADVLARVFAGKLNSRDWCDDVSTNGRETCAEIATGALDAAMSELTASYGDAWSRWRWGEAHVAQGEHRPFSNVAALAPYFEVRVPSPGGYYTLNRGAYRPGDKSGRYLNKHASSYRAIYDFADLDGSLYMHSTGQSGNPLSAFYKNLAARWAKVEYIRIATKADVIKSEAIGTWVLRP